MNKIPPLNMTLKFLLTGLVYFFISISFVFSQTDDELYEQAFEAYSKHNWNGATVLLYKYIKRPPADFADQVFKGQVYAAYNYARAELTKPQGSGGSDDTKGDNASAVSGLTVPPPPLKKPKSQVKMVIVTSLATIDGEWSFKIISASGPVNTDKLTISLDGKIVSGTLVGSNGNQMQVVGSFDTGILILICITGLETTQVYTLRRTDSRHFSGTFKNEGKWPDSGTIDMSK